MQLEMIPCPKCGNDFPLKRKELGYHVCVNCSTTKPVVGITTVEGTGTILTTILLLWIKIQLDPSLLKKLNYLAKKFLEMLDLDTDEAAISQSLKEKVGQVLEDEEDEYDPFDPDKEPEGIEGIDY